MFEWLFGRPQAPDQIRVTCVRRSYPLRVDSERDTEDYLRSRLYLGPDPRITNASIPARHRWSHGTGVRTRIGWLVQVRTSIVTTEFGEGGWTVLPGGYRRYVGGPVYRRRYVSMDLVREEMDRRRLRPADILELLAFSEQYPSVQERWSVAALDAVTRMDDFGARYFACLSERQRIPTVELRTVEDRIDTTPRNEYFLAIETGRR